jgi:hypothetical protein
MKPETMSVDECRDWVALHKGWNRVDPAERCSMDEWWRPTNSGTPGSRTWCIHPCPATLDVAAAAMPEGWRWFKRMVGNQTEWFAMFSPYTTGRRVQNVWIIDTDEGELVARWRLVVACMMAEKEVGDE